MRDENEFTPGPLCEVCMRVHTMTCVYLMLPPKLPPAHNKTGAVTPPH